MVFLLRHLRTVPAAAGLFALLLSVSGCPLSPDSDSGGDPDPDTRVPVRNSVEGAIELYEFTWSNKRYTEYQELLHDQFEYFPQSEDVDDFPWIEGDSWGRTDELGMAFNMFDESFVSAETGNSVDTIDMEVTITNQVNTTVTLGDGTEIAGVEVTSNADATVIWAENTGATSDVRFIFVVVPDPDEPGLWQIIRQEEQPPF